MKKLLMALIGVAFMSLGTIGTAYAETIWGNSYGGGDSLVAFDTSTGLIQKQYNPGLGNGRGVVQVGNILYVTDAFSNKVTEVNATTGAPMGTAFTVSGSGGLATMAYDGTNFWIGDYSGTNHAYEYTPTGTLLKTISLSGCTSFCDGLEYFNGKLISNQGDGCCTSTTGYDIYDTNGTLLHSSFINLTGHGKGTGIAFDGTNFWVSDIYARRLTEWDGTTGAYITAVNLQSGINWGGIEDLSFNYSGGTCQQMGTCPPPSGVPEPSTLLLMGTGMIGVVFWGRKRLTS